MSTPTFESSLEALLVKSLREAYAYAYDKGQQNDQVPDHLKAEVIKQKAKEAILAAHEAAVQEARIAELEKAIEVANEPLVHGRAMAEEDASGGLVYGVEETYLKDRLAELKGGQDE